MGIQIKLQAFEGPLDLLLHLIEKNKVEIYDIPIVEITNQYMQYIKEMERKDLNIMSEFLLMASTLLDIKCRMLLPKEVNEEGEEEDPRQELVDQLLQYKMYKFMSYELKDRQVDTECLMFKDPTIPLEVSEYEEPVDLDLVLEGVSLLHLQKVFMDVMKRKNEKVDPIRSGFGKIEKEEVTLSQKISMIREYARSHKEFAFRQILEKQASRIHIIVTFLAILEMMKMGEIMAGQDHTCAEIMIRSLT